MRLDSLMLGFFGAYVYYFHPQKWLKQKNVLFVSGILLLLYPQIQVFFSSNIWYTQNYFSLLFTAIGTLFLLPKLSQIHQSQSWVYVFFTGISKISYSMYLLHFTIIQWILLPFLSKQFYILEGRDLATALEKYILYCVLTIGLSFLLYKYFEKPMTQLRERFSFTHNNKH